MTNTCKTPLRSPSFPNLPAKQAMMRDVLWGRPLFKAPDLPNPRPRLEPLPFTAVRVTQPA